MKEQENDLKNWFDRYFEEEIAEQQQLWDTSILKWRGISLEDFAEINFELGVFPAFDIGAEVYFMHNNKCMCSKINKIRVFISDSSGYVGYSIDTLGGELNSNLTFASKDELKEHLRLCVKSDSFGKFMFGCEKGYGVSDFRTSVEDIERTGYSIKRYDIPHIGSKFWIMVGNVCKEETLNRIELEITQDGCKINYGLEGWSHYFSPNEIYTSKENLIGSL